MKKQEYLDLKKRHQKEFEDFPIAYAFNDKQLEEALEKLGATKDECVSVFGHGDIVTRENAKPLIALLDRQTKELHQKLRDDHEFAEAAFLAEMDGFPMEDIEELHRNVILLFVKYWTKKDMVQGFIFYRHFNFIFTDMLHTVHAHSSVHAGDVCWSQ